MWSPHLPGHGLLARSAVRKRSCLSQSRSCSTCSSSSTTLLIAGLTISQWDQPFFLSSFFLEKLTFTGLCINQLIQHFSSFHLKMGGTTSSTTVADSVENDSKEMKSQNYGLLNISNESLGSNINVLEIVTFLLILTAAVFFLKSLCARWRKRRIAEMSSHLQGISLGSMPPEYPPQPVVRPTVARLPIMGAPMGAPPPPTYHHAGQSEVEKYNI